MKQKNKLVLIFDSEDFESPQELALHIARVLKEFHSKDFQSDLRGLPPFSKDLVIKINQTV
jgi:hypothetical protein